MFYIVRVSYKNRPAKYRQQFGMTEHMERARRFATRNEAEQDARRFRNTEIIEVEA